ncbi:MAG: hypothetical protein Q7S44_01105 [bacterium]|nr:hypothetical protein [bacterium]
MGKQVKNFRQSANSRSGSQGAQNYGQIQRSAPWHQKFINYFKVRGKGGLNG